MTEGCERCAEYEAALDRIRVALFPLAGSLDIMTLAVPRIVGVGIELRQALIDVGVAMEPDACVTPGVIDA